jgi:hypothetical protein
VEPCLNGGTCTDGVASFSCACADGYEGETCEVDIDECADSPCLNGGTCTDGVAAFSCACADGYEGANCEVDIDECAAAPCLSGGTCTDGVASFSCTCDAGYTGGGGNTPCNVDHDDDCASIDCGAGTCIDLGVLSYMCECDAGYTAGANTLCVEEEDDCDGTACPTDCQGVVGGTDLSCCPNEWDSFVMFSQADVLAKSAQYMACPAYTINSFSIINHDTAYEIVDLFPGLERVEEKFQLTNLGGVTAIDDFKNLTYIGGTFEMVHAISLTSFQGMGEKGVTVGGLYVVNNGLTGCESMPLFNCGMSIPEVGEDMWWSSSACGGAPIQVIGCDGTCSEFMGYSDEITFAIPDCAGTCNGSATYTSPQCQSDPESYECEDSVYDCSDEYTECACVSDTDSCVTSGQGCQQTLICTNGQEVEYEDWNCQDCSGMWGGSDTSCLP